MTTPVFPSTLPKASMQGYAYTPGSNLIRTDMEVGAAKVRRRFVSVPTDVSATWTFTLAELGTFEKFFREQLFDGAAWFQIPVVNGAGETLCTARFKQAYQAETQAREDVWRVSATLEVMNMPTIA